MYDEFGLTFEPGEKVEAVGPFFYRTDAERFEQWAIPPFYARQYDIQADKLSIDILWKLASYDRMGPEYKFQFIQFFGWSGGKTVIEEDQDRKFTVFPFYFQRRSENPERNYTALLPFYGTIQDRLFRDEIHFVMAPLYLQTRKNDVVTDNYLLPFFHLRRGDNLRGWQFWPLIGEEHKGVTTRTNVVGEAETIGPHYNGFVLWPFVMVSHRQIGTPLEVYQESVLPVYYIQRSEARDVTTVLWPFFNYTNDRARGYREWGMPYPFLVWANGPGKNSFRIWPLWGQASNDTLRTRFILSPLYRFKEVKSENLFRTRKRFLYFVYDRVYELNTETLQTNQRWSLWPFYFKTHNWEGEEDLQVLALLEPWLPTSDSLRRTLSPLWSLWRQKTDHRAGKYSESLLWNFYRFDKTPETRKGSVFFGLFRWHHTEETKSWRLFHFLKWGDAQTEPGEESTE